MPHSSPTRLGRTLRLTNRGDGTAEPGVAAYAGPPELEPVFRGLKEGDGLNWEPRQHGTDSQIRGHAFYGRRGLSLLRGVLRPAQGFWPQLTLDKLPAELAVERAEAVAAAYRGPDVSSLQPCAECVG